eukprot:s134_g21.t1
MKLEVRKGMDLDLLPPVSKAHSSKWVDQYACDALCLLIMDDRRIGSTSDRGAGLRRRRALPPFLYVEAIGPFLRFEGLLPNMLYAFGGRNQESGPLDNVEMFNTYHGQWVPAPRMPKRRAGSAAAVLEDGRMMVIGGYTEEGIAQGLLSSCDVFNPLTGEWTQDGAAPLSRGRWGHGCASLQNKVYVVGGCSLQLEAQAAEAFMVTLRHCEIYLPDENRWVPTGALQIPRSGTRVVALDSSHLAAIGGCDDVFGRAETQPTVELYDAHTELWSILPHHLKNPSTASLAALSLRSLRSIMALPLSMESHIGADLLHELMPSAEEDLAHGAPPCLLTAIGNTAAAERNFFLCKWGIKVQNRKTVPYSSKIKADETGSSPSTASELRLVEDTPTCSSLSDSPRRWREMSPMKVPIPEAYRKELRLDS